MNINYKFKKHFIYILREYKRKTYNELTVDAKKHDYDKDGCLNKGTRVTVKEWKNGFARIPSGWVSGDYLKKV